MSTVDRVERSVIDDLLRGVLAPGTRIRQDALAAELGVSKIPVREALQRLSAVGLLQFETNRGATVPALSVAEAQENSTLRAAIEVQLLRQAIPNLTIVDLAEAELALSNTEMGVAESNWVFGVELYPPCSTSHASMASSKLTSCVGWVDIVLAFLEVRRRCEHRFFP